ncbi:MAG TPA: adenosine kinase [Acidimicrobiales bacterium]|nr:adenosine kinase [Acidimicrobiales bacterium]
MSLVAPDLDVVALGSAIVDVIASTDDQTLAAYGLAKGTMALVDADRAQQLYAEMGPAVEVSGGSAANTVAGVASFGGAAGFIGKVRDDQLGEVFAHDIRSIGVHYDTPPATAGEPTARCLVLVTPDGERTMNTFLGAATGLHADDVDPAVIKRAKVTYLEGYLWDPPQAIDALRRAVAVAHEADRLVAFTLSDPFCVDRHRDEFLELIAGDVDVLFANEVEILSLFQVDDVKEALERARDVCQVTAVTRSEHGSVVVSGGDTVVVPAVPVERVVDTTGAGDLYAAGFLFGLARGESWQRCAELGSLAAAEVISHIGARPQVPLASLA